MAEKTTTASISYTADDSRMIDEMMFEDGHEIKSSFFRFLIRQEYARRHATSLQQGAGQTQECADNLRQTCKEVANG